jgi:hypothetical protein
MSNQIPTRLHQDHCSKMEAKCEKMLIFLTTHATLPKKLTKDINDANVSDVLRFWSRAEQCVLVGTENLDKKISSEKGGFYESQSVLCNVFGGFG